MGKKYPLKREPSSKPVIVFTTDNPPSFLDLVDTINTYSGQGGKFLIVKPDESGIGIYLGDVVPDKNYIHAQVAPATVWTVTHNLAKFPAVQAIKTGGYVITGAIRHLSENSLQIIFSEEVAGIAVCN